MRLWHYKMIPYLPKQQLVSQKRECDLMWKDLESGKETNHILINYVWNYKEYKLNLATYYVYLQKEFEKRGYKFNSKLNEDLEKYGKILCERGANPFPKHHNKMYLQICYYNLKEKYLRGQKDFDNDIWYNLNKFYMDETMKDIK